MNTSTKHKQHQRPIIVPPGYRDAYVEAEGGYDMYQAFGIPRYVPREQPTHWHQPQLSRIIEDEAQHYKAKATIAITSSTTSCKAEILPPHKEDRSWKPKRPRHIPVLATEQEDAVTAGDPCLCDAKGSTTSGSAPVSALAKNADHNFLMLVTQQRWRRGRGRANGICFKAIQGFKRQLKSTYVSPSELGGRLIYVTISPGKRQGRKKHLHRIAMLRHYMKAIVENEYGGIIAIAIRMAFARGSKIPHYHLLIFLPQDASLSTCRAISDELFTMLDRRWRQIHGFGISKRSGWRLLATGEDVQRVIDYVCKDEAHEGYVGPWGQSTFVYGELQQPPAEVISVTPQQAMTVAGILLHITGKRVHPWKVNVVVEDVHPRVVLMALLLAGAHVGQRALKRFRVPW